MRYVLLVSLVLVLRDACAAVCASGSRVHGAVRWSEPAEIVAPGRLWAVEVHPVLDADENRTPVVLHSCDGSQSLPLLTLERSAEVYWGPGSKQLLVIDEPLSGTRRLLLFSLPFSGGAGSPSPDALDKGVRRVIQERLGDYRRVQFYLPTLVAWRGDSLVLAVGGATFVGSHGVLSSYCIGLTVNSRTLRVESVLSEEQLRSKTAKSCQVSP